MGKDQARRATYRLTTRYRSPPFRHVVRVVGHRFVRGVNRCNLRYPVRHPLPGDGPPVCAARARPPGGVQRLHRHAPAPSAPNTDPAPASGCAVVASASISSRSPPAIPRRLAASALRSSRALTGAAAVSPRSLVLSRAVIEGLSLRHLRASGLFLPFTARFFALLFPTASPHAPHRSFSFVSLRPISRTLIFARFPFGSAWFRSASRCFDVAALVTLHLTPRSSSLPGRTRWLRSGCRIAFTPSGRSHGDLLAAGAPRTPWPLIGRSLGSRADADLRTRPSPSTTSRSTGPTGRSSPRSRTWTTRASPSRP